MKRIIDRDSAYSARPIQLADYLWLAETLEDFPINGGLTMVSAQNELNIMRRLYRDSRGVGLVTEFDEQPVGITVMSRPYKADDYATITIQATHPDYRRQGHGRNCALLRGFLAFNLESLTHLVYDVENGNTGAESLGTEFHEVSSPGIEYKPGSHMPDSLYKRRVFSAQNWVDFVEAKSIDLTRFSLETL